jgi:hypothetical protein
MKTFYYILLSISILGIPLFIFGIINTMVSLKYETENLEDCISLVTGTDLCQTINTLKILVGLSIAVSISLIVFRKRFLRK